MVWLARMDLGLAWAMHAFCIACMGGLVVVMGGVVAIRFVDPAALIADPAALAALKLSWSDEVIEWLTTAMVFIGAAALWRERTHFKVDLLTNYLRDTPAGNVLAVVIELITAVFIVAFTYYAYDLAAHARRTSPYLSLPMTYWYAPMVICGAIMTLYSARNIVAAAGSCVISGRATPKQQPSQAE